MLFYIIFGTNLLTKSPVPVYVFPCSRVSQKRKTKRSPIDLKIDGDYFWTKRSPQSIGDGPEESQGTHKGGGCALPPSARPPSLWPPHGSSDLISKSTGCLLVQEKSSRKFYSVWTPFDIPFLRS